MGHFKLRMLPKEGAGIQFKELFIRLDFNKYYQNNSGSSAIAQMATAALNHNKR
jgi:hypothetical protein